MAIEDSKNRVSVRRLYALLNDRWTKIKTKFATKVDKVQGKGLSTNDFTDDDKNALQNAYAKPAEGIPEGDLSQDVQDKLNSSGDAYIKPADGIPSSDMTQAVQKSLTKADNSVQQVPGKGLSTNDFTNEDKQNIQDALELAESNVSDISYDKGTLKKTSSGTPSDIVTVDKLKTDMGLSQIKDLGESFISSGNYSIAKMKVSVSCELDINLYVYTGSGYPAPSIIRVSLFSPVSPLTERSGNKFSKLIICQKTPYGNYYPEVAIDCIEESYSSYYLILSIRQSTAPSSFLNATVKWEIRNARKDRPIEVEFGNDYNQMASGATGLSWDKENVLDADLIKDAIRLSESAYQKPQNGIPKADLVEGVQNSLDSAGTAMQSIGSSDTSADLDGTEKLAINVNGKNVVFSTISKLWSYLATKLAEPTTNIGGDAATASSAKSGSSLATELGQKELASNKKQSVDPTSTTDYPSSKALADYVGDAVSLAAADYISDNGEPFTSVNDLPTDVSKVSNNDYAFVTGTDEAGNTYYDRYKATVEGSTVTWGKEFRLNNSSFTAAQWNAITSGITAALVASYNNHLANSDIHVTTGDKSAWNAKYDKPAGGIPSIDLTQGVQDLLNDVNDPEEGSLVDLLGDGEFIGVTESNGTITASLIAETEDYEV